MSEARAADPQVVIVGSGPAGVSAAWPLVRAGVRVLMLDASRDPPIELPVSESAAAFRADPERWRARFGSDLAGLGPSANLSPKFATSAGRAALTDFTHRLDLESSGFLAAGSLGRGGLSAIWGALVAEFEDAEFEGSSLSSADMAPFYQEARDRIGVSGGPNGDAEVSHAPSRELLQRFRNRPASGGFRIEPAMNAVLGEDRGQRKACTLTGLCLYGCSRGSIYDSGSEIPDLAAFANFSYRPDHLVRALIPHDGGHRLRCETSAGERLVGAPIVALAAGVISTSLLALSRLGQTDKPIRLLSNPTMGAAFVMPRFIGRDLAERTSSLGQLIYRLQLGADEVVGVLYGADALPLDLFAARMPLSRPVSLRVARALAPALIMATCYLPGRYSANTLTAMRTASGLRRRIEASQTPQATAALKAAMQALARNLRPLGALMVPSSATLAPPGADAHQAGTFPMGTATSKFGELVGADGVYLVDGSCLPRLPAIHPTLTIMANAGRIGGEIARRALAS